MFIALIVLSVLQEWGIRHRFEFLSELQRMSVLAEETATGRLFAFVKGSPEALRPLCTPESIPPDFEKQTAAYAHQGYRVIALAFRDLGKWPLPASASASASAQTQTRDERDREKDRDSKNRDSKERDRDKEDAATNSAKALRSYVEQQLVFAGLVVLENKLKPETAPTLAILQRARIRCVMVTG